MFRSSPSPLAVIAAACLLTVALPAGSAMAQKTKSKGPAATTETTSSMPDVGVYIPEIVTADSNVDEATLRDIFSGELSDNADALAGLTASSIDIPEIIIEVSVEVDGETSGSTLTVTDISLGDVTEGVAATVSLGGFEMSGDDDASGSFGAMQATDFNIAALLGLYGLVEPDSTEMETLYSSFSFDGGTISAPDGECTLGEVTGAEVRVRPIAFSFAEFFTLVEQLEAAEDEPPPELVGQAMRMYADFMTAMEADPISFGGFDCAFQSDDGEQVRVAVGSGEADAFTVGHYPAISFEDIELAVVDDGEITIGNFTFKGIDLTNLIDTLASAPESVDAAWFEANARLFVPAFEGISIADVSVDIPDPQAPKTRIKASLGAFDLTLGDYRNGIPAAIATSLEGLVVALPKNSQEESVHQLISMGITSIDAGFNLDLAWDEAENTIKVNDVSVSAADLASIAIGGTITSATIDLFDLDADTALAAAMALTVSDVQVEVTDDGASDLVLEQVAAEQGARPADLRTVFAGLAQGTIVGQLATAANAQQVAQAVAAFVQGTAKTLSLDLTAKAQPGVGLVDFLAASENPAALLDKVDVSAEAH